MLDTAVQEKHPAKLGLEALDPTLEANLVKAFNPDIIYLNEQRKKNIEIMKKAYYYNFEISYLIHYALQCFMNEDYQNAFSVTSHIIAESSNIAQIDKLLRQKKDILYKHLQIFT